MIAKSKQKGNNMYIAIIVVAIIVFLLIFVNKAQKNSEERYIQPPLHDGLCISELPASITVFRHGRAIFRANKQCVFFTDKPGIIGIEHRLDDIWEQWKAGETIE